MTYTDDKTVSTHSEGLLLALAAYLIWGVVPVYFKFLQDVAPFELVSHRVIWSLLFLFGLLTVTKNWSDLRINKRQLVVLLATSGLLAGNWLIFIWAILHNNITETSLGYFINPLVSVFLGMLFLGERLRPLQWIALVIAGAGIGFQLYFYGSIPWVALSLALCFGFYGLLRKQLAIASFAGLTLESLLILPGALIYLIWLGFENRLQFGHLDLETDLLLVASGLVTAIPLLCFASAVTRLSLTTMGILQYLAPSISLLIAVFVYDEAFDPARAITFSCIWVALVIFGVESFLRQKRLPT